MCKGIKLGEVGACGSVCGTNNCPAVQAGNFTQTLVDDIVGGTHGNLSPEVVEYLISEGGQKACDVHAMKIAGLIAQGKLGFGS